MEFEAGVLNNNLNGDIAALAIDTNTDTLFCSNMKKWANTTIMLAKHSDREGVLSVYPDDTDNVYAAAYNLINIYNKGLMGAHTDFNAMQTKSGWIYNDEKANIGFYPQVYSKSSNLYVRAKNSSTDKNVYFVISKEEYSDINKTTPVREGFEDESMVDIMVGAGVSYLAWDTNSKVEKNDHTYADTEYDISNSLYKELYFQGRVGNTQLAVSYAQNEAEKKRGLTKKGITGSQYICRFQLLGFGLQFTANILYKSLGEWSYNIH